MAAHWSGDPRPWCCACSARLGVLRGGRHRARVMVTGSTGRHRRDRRRGCGLRPGAAEAGPSPTASRPTPPLAASKAAPVPAGDAAGSVPAPDSATVAATGDGEGIPGDDPAALLGATLSCRRRRGAGQARRPACDWWRGYRGRRGPAGDGACSGRPGDRPAGGAGGRDRGRFGRPSDAEIEPTSPPASSCIAGGSPSTALRLRRRHRRGLRHGILGLIAAPLRALLDEIDVAITTCGVAAAGHLSRDAADPGEGGGAGHRDRRTAPASGP